MKPFLFSHFIVDALHAIAHKHGNRHRTYTTRYRGDSGSDWFHFLITDISEELLVLSSVDADIDHNSSLFYIIRSDKLLFADGND